MDVKKPNQARSQSQRQRSKHGTKNAASTKKRPGPAGAPPGPEAAAQTAADSMEASGSRKGRVARAGRLAASRAGSKPAPNVPGLPSQANARGHRQRGAEASSRQTEPPRVGLTLSIMDMGEAMGAPAAKLSFGAGGMLGARARRARSAAQAFVDDASIAQSHAPH